VTTVGGLIVEHLGRIPAAGDRVEVEGHVLEAVSVRGRVAERVRIQVPAPAAVDEPVED
jgi:CBS domain containing-hemolysin-like protein